jgi:hypothetical protein
MRTVPDRDTQQTKQRERECLCVCVCVHARAVSHVIVADVTLAKQADLQKYALRSTNTT